MGFSYELVTLGKTLTIGRIDHPRQIMVGDLIEARGGRWLVTRLEAPATPSAYARVVSTAVRAPHFDRVRDEPDEARELLEVAG